MGLSPVVLAEDDMRTARKGAVGLISPLISWRFRRGRAATAAIFDRPSPDGSGGNACRRERMPRRARVLRCVPLMGSASTSSYFGAWALTFNYNHVVPNAGTQISLLKDSP
jgi:hypothetical protein